MEDEGASSPRLITTQKHINHQKQAPYCVDAIFPAFISGYERSDKMTEEIPIWVNGIIQWVSGVDRKTTCKDVIEAVLLSEGNDRHNVKDYTIMERWRRVERPLDENSKILKIWSHWGDEKKEVRFCLKRINNEIDSGRGSPVGIGSTPSLKRRRHHRSRGNGKPPWTHHETLHPKRLAELGELNKEEYEEYQARKMKPFDPYENKSDNEYDNLIYDSRHCTYGEKIYGRKPDENGNPRKKTGHRSYQCSGTGVLHSTLLSPNEEDCSKPTTSKCCSKRQSKSKVRNSENIEKLMKLILAQGATIQNQLQKLKEREEQIESLEHDRHKERVEKNGRNYLLETYLGSLDEAEIPVEEERGNDSGVHTEGGGSDRNVGHRTEKQTEDGSQTKSLPSRSKRSRSESRSVEYKFDDKENCLKRTLSDNALAEGSETREDSTREEEKKEHADNLLELRRIQSQMDMWEKVFKINKKLEKEEENLVRLHIKIKRFQKESVTLAVEDSEVVEEDNHIEEDRKTVQKDLDTLREDLDQNSKEIYQNFTKLKENDEVVEQKRTILKRLINDLEETEQEHTLLSKMVQSQPDEELNQNEGRTSFSDRTAEEEAFANAEIVPIRLYNTPCVKTANDVAHANQRVDFAKRDDSEVKPKIVKISFDDQIQPPERNPGPLREHNTTGTIKGILKNRNCNESADYDWRKENVQEQIYEDNYSRPSTEDRYPILSYPVYETHNYYRPNPTAREGVKRMFPKPNQSDQSVYVNRNLMSSKTNLHNDTDSSTSSDTSGMCSMYSSSPTAEEPYTEPTYVLDTLV